MELKAQVTRCSSKLLSQKIIVLSAYFLPETLPSTTQVSAWEGAPFTEASEETLAPSLACPQWSHNCVPAAAAAVYVLTNLGDRKSVV